MRDMAYCYFFGAGTLLDAWFIAFKIPNLSRRLLGEGAASASFIPIYSQQLHHDRKKAATLANTVLTVLFILLAAIVLLGEAGIWVYYKYFGRAAETRLVLSLTSIMLPYMLFVCLVAALAGVLNVHRHFAAPAAAPIVLNIFIIATILITGWVFKIQPRQQVFAVAVAVLLAGVVQLTMQMPILHSKGVSIRPAWDIYSDEFRKIIFLMGPMILGLTVTQINTLADDLIAWWFSASVEKGEFFVVLARQIEYPLQRGCVTHLNVARRLCQWPLGVFGISLGTAIFPVMSAEAARRDFPALCKTVSRGLRGAVFVALPATAGLLLVGRPLVRVIFQRGRFAPADTVLAANVLLFYVIGLCGYFAQQILARAFYSVQDSKMPARSALAAVCANIVLNLTLIWFLGTAGLAFSTALCSYLQVVMLAVVLRRRLGREILYRLPTTVAKTAAATLCMSIVALCVLRLLQNWPDILRLIVVVPLSAGIFLLTAKALQIRMLALYWHNRH